MKKRFVGGNWKCFNTISESKQIIAALHKINPSNTQVVVAPVSIHIPIVLA